MILIFFQQRVVSNGFANIVVFRWRGEMDMDMDMLVICRERKNRKTIISILYDKMDGREFFEVLLVQENVGRIESQIFLGLYDH